MCIPLLPLLELSHTEAVSLIRQGLKQAEVDLNLLDSFPFDHTLYLALDWETGYWASLAVKWLEEGYPGSEKFIDCLKKWQKKKKHSQSLRHRAKHLIKQYEGSPHS
jgi:hypothetical protein